MNFTFAQIFAKVCTILGTYFYFIKYYITTIEMNFVYFLVV